MNKTNKNIRYIPKLSLIALLFIGLNACISEPKKKEDSTQDEIQEVVEESGRKEKVREIFYSFPSPIELSILFKQEGITFNTDILHDVDAVDRYNIHKKQALNLGVYGADLSYAGIFEKQQEAIKLYNNCKKLAESLGVVDDEYTSLLKRLEKNQEEKDSVLTIISSFFLSNDANLKENQQENLSSYILAGGWIEGMYLGTKMYNDEEKGGLKSILIAQKKTLQNLINLLEDTSADEDDFFEEMKELLVLYEKIEVKKEITNQEKVEEKEGKLVLNTSKSKAKISNDLLEEIKTKIEELRAIIIQ